MEIIQHFSHQHLLSLSEYKIEEYRVRCDLCDENCDEGEMIYSCRESKCDFNLHESCAKLPQELHNPLLHPHPLSLQLASDDECNRCHLSCYGFTFRCDKCENFQVDLKCGLIRPAAIEEGEEEAVVVGTHHFLHPEHPLLLLQLQSIPVHRFWCHVCGGSCSNQKAYGCLTCGFFLHPSCFKLPQQIFHPFHPYHGPLTLKRINRQVVKCNACRINRQVVGVGCFIFRCDECENFQVDVKCAFIRPAAIEEGEEDAVVVGTHHFTHHEHPLVPLENIPADLISCFLCGGWCSDPKTYGCVPCGFFLHPSCFNLPQEIFHPFHPYHGPLTLKPIMDPLTLKRITYDDAKCNACRNDLFRDEYFGCFAYFCKHCNNTENSFCLDTKCARVIMPAITYEGHDHLLQFVDNTKNIGDESDEELIEHCSDDRGDESDDFDEELIKHCSDDRGDESDDSDEEPIKSCSACKSTCKSTCESYGFRCLDLHFDYISVYDELIKCSACKSPICEESYAFICLNCDFSLHLTCGPLPSTIQHKSHIHPLILTNCPIEDEQDCEPDEFYCNACEEERDPFLPIYYCNECPFVAGISCVISEVVSLLKGEHGDVELRNPFGQFGNLIREKHEQKMIKPALTLFVFFNSLSTAEKKELDGALQWDRLFDGSAIGSETEDLRSKTNNWEDSGLETNTWGRAKIILKGDEAYTQFMKFVDIGLEIPIEFRDTEDDVQISDFKFCYMLLPKEEVVDIEDYKITRKLAPILKNLFSKYGDVSAESELSPKVKLYFFHMLCECIYSMMNTKIMDITPNVHLNWWTSLVIIDKAAKFRIQFAFDHLKRVALAHFGHYIEEKGSKALEKLDRDIKELKRKRECLPSIRSSLIEKCFRETSMLKGWKAIGLLKAGVGL